MTPLLLFFLTNPQVPPSKEFENHCASMIITYYCSWNKFNVNVDFSLTTGHLASLHILYLPQDSLSIKTVVNNV
jgi:hypothetical protein